MGESFDVYQLVTDRIIEALESELVPWRRPWVENVGMPRSLSTGKPYRGINSLLLGVCGQPFGTPWWGTYNTVAAMGGQVRKGQKSSIAVLWRTYASKSAESEPDGGEAESERMRFVLRYYRVFNAAQCEGLTLPTLPELPMAEFTPDVRAQGVADRYLHNGGPTLSHDVGNAYYIPSTDEVHLPAREAFESVAGYYDTLFHELGHSTGHKKRLNRKEDGVLHRFGSPAYAREELVAEITSAMLCGHVGIDQDTLPNQAAYVANWLTKLRGDKRLVVVAAAAAQKSADVILGVEYNS